MSSSARGLLLLPLPPQRPTYLHVWTALYPSLRSAIRQMVKLGCAGETAAALEIVLPVTRLTENTHTRQDLLVRVNPLVANIYRLVAAVYNELDVPQDRLDIRVLFVRGKTESDSDDGEMRLRSAAIQNCAELAMSGKPWTHVFAVESEQGEETYLKFRALSRKRGPKREVLFAKVQRVASGIQIYTINDPPTPSTAASVENALTMRESPASPRDVVVVVRGNTADQLTDKYLLTMALFAISPLDKPPDDEMREDSVIHVVCLRGDVDDKLRAWTSEFLEAMFATLDRGIRLSFEEKPCLSANTVVVCDSQNDLDDGWRAETGATLVLEPIRADDMDVED